MDLAQMLASMGGMGGMGGMGEETEVVSKVDLPELTASDYDDYLAGNPLRDGAAVTFGFMEEYAAHSNKEHRGIVDQCFMEHRMVRLGVDPKFFLKDFEHEGVAYSANGYSLSADDYLKPFLQLSATRVVPENQAEEGMPQVTASGAVH